MSATTADWVDLENVIEGLLPSEGEGGDRVQLLRSLYAYAESVVAAAHGLGITMPGEVEVAAALNWLEKPVFVCGHHRSGTTLMQQLLDGHPDLVTLPSEGTYFSSFRRVARRNPEPSDVDRFVAEWIARLIDPNQEPHFKLGRSTSQANPSLQFAQRVLGWIDVLRRARPALRPFAPLLALPAAYRSLAPTADCPRMWVEKTPLNECNVARFEAFEQARFIQLVRDPDATHASLSEHYRRADRYFDGVEHTLSIARSLRLAVSNQRCLGDRYLVVRYEDLTDDPASVMQRVSEFLGMSFHPTLLTPTVGKRAVRSNSSFERSVAGVVQPGLQRGTPSVADRRMVRTLTRSAARALGYEVPGGGVVTGLAIRLRYLPVEAVRQVKARIRRAASRAVS